MYVCIYIYIYIIYLYVYIYVLPFRRAGELEVLQAGRLVLELELRLPVSRIYV